jgi:tetratricopeptide (TPR) repeat protein
MAKKKIVPEPISTPEVSENLETPLEVETETPIKKKKNGLFILSILAGVLVITALGGLAGYYAGLQVRRAAEENNRAVAAATQFQLGLEDFNRGNYDFAQQRFEYVIQLNPSFPGVLEKMAEIAIITSSTATPEPTPAATAMPTFDSRNVDGLLGQVQQFLVAHDWDSALLALDAMRKDNPAYKTLEVDGLYYLAYRNRGIDQIQKHGKLEKGIFDIAMMTLYGPIDKDARDATEWASYYIYGASFYKIDWGRVIRDLQIVNDNYPYLLDQGGVPATTRYWTALYKYGVQLWQENSTKNACKVYNDYYMPAWNMNQNIPQEDLNQLGSAKNLCEEQLKNHAPTFTVSTLPDAQVSIAYDTSITATDPDKDKLQFSITSGDLTAYGLAMDSQGHITGTPTTPGTITISVQVTDNREDGTLNWDFTINILP